MSFIVKSIEISNIRVHDYFKFEPALTGITAISGENGSGKSTIVDSLAWCLYGTRVNNIRNKDMIRYGVNPRDEDVKVTVVMLSGGIEYTVERKIINQHGTTECNIWGKMEGGPGQGNHIAGPGVSHVENFIKQTLNMDEKGFLTSILIQQKQVDQIVSASPRERGEVIEKLTGIASITQAIDLANEENRALNKASLLLKKGNLEEAQEKYDSQKKVCEGLQKDIIDLSKKYKSELEDLKSEVETLNAEREKLNKSIEMENELTLLKDRTAMLKEQSNEDMEFISKHRKAHGVAIGNLDELNQKRQEASNKLSSKKAMISSIETKIKDLAKYIESYKTYDYDKEQSELIKLKDKSISLNEKLDNLKTTIATIKADIKHTEASLDGIDCNDKKCPTCNGELQDPELLIEELEGSLDEMKESLKKHNKESKAIKENIANLQEDLNEKEDLINKLLMSKEKESELINLEDKLKSEAKELNELEIDYSSAEKAYEVSLKAKADEDALEAAKSRAKRATLDIGINNDRIEKLTVDLRELNAMTQAKFRTFERKVASMDDSKNKLAVEGKSLENDLKLAKARLGDYKENLEEVQKTLKEHEEIANQIKVLTSTSAVLTEFKKDRIEYSIPTLEFYASDILTKFTGGAFNELHLDDKFNTTVTTDEGVTRPISQLSGGELSAAAISLRLGIALLLNGNEQNALIFDEVLVSMDEERARQIMETIASITNCQVIFIAHNTDINSIADKVVEIKRD